MYYDKATSNTKLDSYYNKTYIDHLINLYYTKLRTDQFINNLHTDINKIKTVVSPYEAGVNDYSCSNIPSSTIPLCVRNSNRSEHIENFYDNSIVFYKQIVFTPGCTFSGQNAPCTALQVDSIGSQLNDAINTKQDIITTKSW